VGSSENISNLANQGNVNNSGGLRTSNAALLKEKKKGKKANWLGGLKDYSSLNSDLKEFQLDKKATDAVSSRRLDSSLRQSPTFFGSATNSETARPEQRAGVSVHDLATKEESVRQSKDRAKDGKPS